MTHRLEPLSVEELEIVSKEITEVLERHGCEMGTTTTVTISKRVEVPEASDTVNTNGDENKTEEASPTE